MWGPPIKVKVSRAAGFTLVELLVVIAIVGVLLSLALPMLATARNEAKRALCLTNTSSCGQLFHVYSTDNRDLLPNAGPVERTIRAGEQDWRVGGVERGLSNGRWAALFPEDWSGPHWNRALRCPLQPRYDPEAPPGDPARFKAPRFWMSEVVWLDGVLLASARNRAEARHRWNSLFEVTFPSRKVYVFEFPGFCVSNPTGRAWALELGQTPYWPVSTLFFDGSCRRTIIADGRASVLGGWPYFHTPDGVRGWDLP